MRRQSRQLLILLILLGIVAAGFFGVRQYNKAQNEKTEEEDKIKVLDINSADVIRFSYDYLGTTYFFEKEGDTWYYADDHSIPLIQFRLTTMVTYLAPLKAEQAIDNVTDLSQYGLAEPVKTVNFETETESHTLQIGDYNSVAGIHYAIVDGNTEKVYTIQGSMGNSFSYSLDDLKDTVAEEKSN